MSLVWNYRKKYLQFNRKYVTISYHGTALTKGKLYRRLRPTRMISFLRKRRKCKRERWWPLDLRSFKVKNIKKPAFFLFRQVATRWSCLHISYQNRIKSELRASRTRSLRKSPRRPFTLNSPSLTVINAHFLHAVFYTFPIVMQRRICLTV